MPKLSAQLYTVRDFLQTPEDIRNSLQKIRAIGYRAVEISSLQAVTSAAAKSMLDDAGLAVSGIHHEFNELTTDLETALERTRAFHTRHLLLSMMPETYAEQGQSGYQQFIEEIIPISEQVHQAGFTLSYHNHNYEFTRFDGRTGLDWILEATAAHHFGVQLDTYWIQMGGGNPVEWIRKVKDRMPAIHCKDFAVAMWTPTFAAVGQGNLNWNEIIPACYDAGVEWFVVEQDECPGDPFRSLEQSYAFLKRFGELS